MKTFSLDTERIAFYRHHVPGHNVTNDKDLYRNAFKLAGEKEAEFSKFADASFQAMLRHGLPIIVDNTNTSKKSRKKWISAARQKGYNVQAVLFPISKEVLLKRSQSRTDKTVPDDAILGQYSRVALPWPGSEVNFYTICEQS
jgi:predicted kinase